MKSVDEEKNAGIQTIETDDGLRDSRSEDSIHMWFELTYAQYLTIPRSVLQSMPSDWQSRFVRSLRELDDTFDWRPQEGRYWVRLKNRAGRYVHDPLMDYERGRRHVPARDAETSAVGERS